MDKYRYDNRSDQWRKRAGAKPRRSCQMAGVPERLVFLTLAAVVAYVTLFVMQHSDPVPDLDQSDLIGSSPTPIGRYGRTSPSSLSYILTTSAGSNAMFSQS